MGGLIYMLGKNLHTPDLLTPYGRLFDCQGRGLNILSAKMFIRREKKKKNEINRRAWLSS
jgi:hypothetical protein